MLTYLALWVVLAIIVILAAVFSGIGMARFVQRHFEFRDRSDANLIGALSGFATLTLFALTACLLPCLNFSGNPVAIVAPDGRVVKIFSRYEPLWRWDKRLTGNRAIDLFTIRLSTVIMELQPITSNPKVRQLRYSVNVEAPNLIDARLKYLNKFGDLPVSTSTAEKFVKFQLYEFEERYSKELAMLYNPLDDKQQEALLELVQTSIGSDLESVGLRITEAKFEFASLTATTKQAG